ncbi:peptidylprolyl isomerase [Rhodococcus sp. NPDC058521]|uniref:peptidylprolyl isomerase n=1 Tax=Rhodococcus sp. NPDC058521 TaxID=3346536 RepID=UPI003660D523
MKRTPLLVAGISLALALTACSDDSGDSASATSEDAASTTASSAAEEAPIDTSQFAALPEVPAGAATVSCAYQPGGPAAKDVTPPAADNVPGQGTVNVDLDTSAGPIGLELSRDQAPCTVNSFVNLTEQKYFDDTPCHRLVTSQGLQVLQCGDPTGSGSGGPGYQYATEYPETTYAQGDPALQQPMVYPRGTIAMANTGQPESNGSQFFLVYEDSILPPTYTVFGTISEDGLATIEKVAADGDDGSMPAGGGTPNTPVQIETAIVA